ncbi:septal ring lytic transglycosylase RlpA family protein [Candidatus Paracaedibacter symbiosus]|uniref:septal ring lytic transglycosylase RlpA family protein n=1 Tax=Candidatus Paracaedibacter symbiosus TaxID=244582 RepID=UPI0022B322A9|nr:septal ring lytic transglycosylase RlpA family protein [Candidatus Paracaedibacter symbiosus]
MKVLFLMCVVLGAGLLLSGCASTPVKKTPAKELCSGTKKPYEIKGVRYTPQDHYDYEESGVASWYGPGFHQRPGSCGSKYDMHSYTAAHKTLPIPSVVEVTNTDNGKSLHLVINDRGPFVDDRIIDLSKKAAIELGTHGKGLGNVRVKALPEQSVALANYLKQYGRYGMDPSGRAWDQIYRDEIAENHHQYLDHTEPKVSQTVYQPETDIEVAATLAVLNKPTSEPIKPPTTQLTYTKKVNNDGFEALLNEAAQETPVLARTTKAQPIRVSAPVASQPSNGIHYIQVGSFVQKQNALKTQQNLRHHGKVAVALSKAVRGQQFFTVKLGPYASKKQAQKVMETVVRNGYHGVTLTAN